jgi:hypothetical protein
VDGIKAVKTAFNKAHINRFILSCLLWFLLIIGCRQPLSEQEKEAIVKTLVQQPLPSGEYVLFWDGTDEKDQFVPAGTYYARLYSRDFTYQIEMTALAGGTGVSNDSTVYNGVIQPLTKLEQNRPNPFYIQDGTNIPFTIDEQTANTTVQLTIRNRN